MEGEAAHAQKLKDDEALAAKQVKDCAPVELVEKEDLAKTYANVVQSSSSPPPSAVSNAISPSSYILFWDDCTQDRCEWANDYEVCKINSS